MEKSEIIMLVGIIVATVWLLFCIIVEGEKRKYEIAVRELKGKKNVAIVITIFIVMIFLMMGIAHPDIKIDLSM